MQKKKQSTRVQIKEKTNNTKPYQIKPKTINNQNRCTVKVIEKINSKQQQIKI